MPPLPSKKKTESGFTAGPDFVKETRSASSSTSVSTSAKDAAEIASTNSFTYHFLSAGESQAVHEALLDPSKWVLKNRQSGQEVEAALFVEELMARRPAPQWPTAMPQSGSTGGKSWPRRRNRALFIQRPTLLPQSSSDAAAFALNAGGSPNPPSIQLPFPNMPSRSSPMRARGRTLLPSNASSRTRSVSDSHGRSNSDSTTSSVILSANEGQRPFKLNNLSTIQIVANLHPGGIRAMAFSPSGEFLATCGVDQRCCVFRILQRVPDSPNTAAVAEVKGLRRRRALVPVASDVLVDDEPMRILTGHLDSIVALTWADDDNVLLTGSADGTVRCWHPLKGDECVRVYEHGGGVTSVAWDPATSSQGGGSGSEGRFLTGCMDAKIRLFSLSSVEAKQSVLTERPVTAVAFFPGGQSIAAGHVSGTVTFYHVDGMRLELTVECRRHGFRHTAAQRTRLATSPVRRLSAGTGVGQGSGNGTGSENIDASIDAKANANVNGSINSAGTARGRRRRNTLGPTVKTRLPGSVEERITGLCFRPAGKGLAELTEEEFLSDPHPVGEACVLSRTPSSNRENMDKPSQERAPNSSVGGEVVAQQAGTSGIDGSGNPWVGRLEADLLVSTNDNRSRILVSGDGHGVVVGFKLKGHNSEGRLGRHTSSRYSEDGNLVVSGSADGNVHMWPTPNSALVTNTPRRAVTWSSGREGHQRAQVCSKNVGIPVAMFAPDSVSRTLGGASSRVIVTGDNEGCLKVFCDRNTG
ncbi:unnamed protein product [Scytosiphon promiscuus]